MERTSLYFIFDEWLKKMHIFMFSTHSDDYLQFTQGQNQWHKKLTQRMLGVNLNGSASLALVLRFQFPIKTQLYGFLN